MTHSKKKILLFVLVLYSTTQLLYDKEGFGAFFLVALYLSVIYKNKTSKMNKITLKPHQAAACEEMAFKMCQAKGWFADLEFEDLTDENKQEFYFIESLDIAVYSFDYWIKWFNY